MQYIFLIYFGTYLEIQARRPGIRLHQKHNHAKKKQNEQKVIFNIITEFNIKYLICLYIIGNWSV